MSVAGQTERTEGLRRTLGPLGGGAEGRERRDALGDELLECAHWPVRLAGDHCSRASSISHGRGRRGQRSSAGPRRGGACTRGSKCIG